LNAKSPERNFEVN